MALGVVGVGKHGRAGRVHLVAQPCVLRHGVLLDLETTRPCYVFVRDPTVVGLVDRVTLGLVVDLPAYLSNLHNPVNHAALLAGRERNDRAHLNRVGREGRDGIEAWSRHVSAGSMLPVQRASPRSSPASTGVAVGTTVAVGFGVGLGVGGSSSAAVKLTSSTISPISPMMAMGFILSFLTKRHPRRSARPAGALQEAPCHGRFQGPSPSIPVWY